jgi:hypothetical protein
MTVVGRERGLQERYRRLGSPISKLDLAEASHCIGEYPVVGADTTVDTSKGAFECGSRFRRSSEGQ